MATATADQPAMANHNTVYVTNIDDRIHIPMLADTLRVIFGTCGSIIDIVAKANPKLHGQAFVVFENEAGAAKAIEEVDGFAIFGRPLKCSWARMASDVVAKQMLDQSQLEKHKRQRQALKDQRIAAEEAANKAKAASGARQQPKAKPAQSHPDVNRFLPPNRKLQVQNVPAEFTEEMLVGEFEKFPGFVEVRTVPGRSGLAFVEYEDTEGAIAAKAELGDKVVGAEGQRLEVFYLRQGNA